MPLLLRRSIPWAAAVILTGAMEWFVRNPLSYPWPQLAGLAVFLFSFVALAYKRMVLMDAVGYGLPSTLTLVGLGGALLLADSSWERMIYSAAFVGIPLLVLELLYMLTSDPVRYPVNALSRINIALAPLAIFSMTESLVGVYVFAPLPWWCLLLVLCLVSAIFVFATSHPTADKRHRIRWTVIGAVIGLHAAVLGMILPVGMTVSGTLAAFLLAFPLRTRRYAFAPVPSRAHAWTEGALGSALVMALLLSARWA